MPEGAAMSEKVKIKRCPFCGAKGTEMTGMDDYWIECSDTEMCAARGPWRPSPYSAIRAWNAKNKRKEQP